VALISLRNNIAANTPAAIQSPDQIPPVSLGGAVAATAKALGGGSADIVTILNKKRSDKA
jgi:hypothetical protein